MPPEDQGPLQGWSKMNSQFRKFAWEDLLRVYDI
jgi:hypothetical protein